MKPRGKKLTPFVPLLKDTMKTDAWKALSHAAKALYVLLKWKYNRNLGNAVYMSTRDAANQMKSNRDYVMRWFRELQYYGFIVMVSPGCLGVEGRGKAPHWRLTEEWYIGQVPTRDFLKWDGVAFHEQKSPKHYLQKKQNPGPQTGATLAPKLGPLPPKSDGRNGTSGPQTEAIQPQPPGPQTEAITSLTTRGGEARADAEKVAKARSAEPPRPVLVPNGDGLEIPIPAQCG
jgi:hypothetical protein